MSWNRAAFAALLTLAVAAPAAAQRVPYREDFEGAASGWLLNGLWGIDGSPSAMPGGAASSGAKSLNFNNGVDYAGVQRASCSSPVVMGQAPLDHVVRFRCNYRTETTGTRYDRRSVSIRSNGEVVRTVVLSGQSSAPAEARCAAMGTWHSHELRIAGSTASRTQLVQLDFVFESVDAVSNAFPGWFVDDVEVQALGAPAAQVFTSVLHTTNDFRDLTVATEVRGDRSVEIRRSSPTARFALVSGRATDAEWQALEQSVQSARFATLPKTIPDPNVYIVRPTTFELTIDSAIAGNANSVGGSVGVYGQWAAQLDPIVVAIEAIKARLLGGPAPAGDDHGDTPQAATTLSLDPSQPAAAGAIDPAGDKDVFQFAEIVPLVAIFPPPQRTYTVETTVVGNMDTVIDLLAADGTTVLATNDDASGLGLGSRVVHTGPQGSVYFVRVRHYSATGTGSYAIRASSKAAPGGSGPVADDHANTAAQGTTLEKGGPVLNGAIDPAGDVDWFQVSAMVIAIYPPPTLTYTIETTVTGSMDTILELYAADGVTMLASNDDASGLGLGSRIVYTAQAAPYYVRVRHYSASGTGSYTVRAK